MTIIDRIIRAAAQQYRKRLITDPEEAARLGVRVGDMIAERVPTRFNPEK